MTRPNVGGTPVVTQQPSRPLDSALVEEIRREESAAEAALYERFSARVYYLARRRLGSREHAEDVRAETFVRVLQAIRQNRIRSPESLPSFILQTAHNVIREWIRQEWKAGRLSRELGAGFRQPPAAADLQPQVLRALEQTIDGLGSRERAFLQMYYYEELPNEVIARRLGIKEERVRLIKSRTLQRFREAYARMLRDSRS